MDSSEVGLYLGTVPFQNWNGELPLEHGPGKTNPSVLPVRKCDEFPLFQSEEEIGPYLAHFPLPFCDPGVGGHEIGLFADAGHRSVYFFKEPFVVMGGIRIIGLAEELMGQVGKDGPGGVFPVHDIVLCLVLYHVDRGDIKASQSCRDSMHIEKADGWGLLQEQEGMVSVPKGHLFDDGMDQGGND